MTTADAFDPYEHEDYRQLLRAWLGARSARSQTMLAKRIGVSRSMVAMVLASERDIPLSAARKWSGALGLDADATQFFELLVRCDSPISLDLRRQARTQAASIRGAKRAWCPTPHQAQMLGKWFVPVIMEMTKVPGFRLEQEWIQDRLWPEVEADELAITLEALQELGVVRMVDGRPKVEIRPMSTPQNLSEELSRIGRAYHRDQLDHAALALDEQDSETRHLGSATVAIRADRLAELHKALYRFQLEVIEPFRASEDADSVVQVSVQLFSRLR